MGCLLMMLNLVVRGFGDVLVIGINSFREVVMCCLVSNFYGYVDKEFWYFIIWEVGCKFSGGY